MNYYDYKKTPVRFGSNVRAVLYEPVVPTEFDHIIFPFNYALALVAEEMAKRGYKALRIEDGQRGPMQGDSDDMFVMLSQATDYCRAMPGIDTVIGINWSGGNTAMTAYQSIAENGADIYRNPERIIKVGDVGVLSPVDGLVTIDSNYGNGMMTLLSLDPAIIDETNGQKRDPELDLWNPANGFEKDNSHYSKEFAAKFQKAQGERMNRLIDYCLDRVTLINQGKGNYIDDEPLIIPGGNQIRSCNMLFSQDPRYLGSTNKPFPQIHPDGSVVTEIIKTVRPPMNNECTTTSWFKGGRVMTVKNFLKGTAIRTKDFGYDESHFYGVEWDSTYATTLGNAAGIHVPILSMGFTASWEFIGVETILERVQSKDKQGIFVLGASHNAVPEPLSEKYPGEFGDTVKHAFDYIAQWVGDGKRFH